MDDSGGWPWFWLIAAAVLAVGELITPGAFFMLSFAVGAAIACLLGFLDVDIAIQWLVFVVASSVSLAILVPVGRRMTRGDHAPVGATRFQGMTGVVLETIPAGDHETGLVRVEREQWRAENVDGDEMPPGTAVTVVRVDGTRLIVRSRPEVSP